MSPLRIPFWTRAVGSAAGWTVYGLLRTLYALPRPVLLLVITAIQKSIAGETALSRSLDFVRQTLRSKGHTASVLNQVVTRTRPGEVAGIVRGVVIRRLS